MRRRGDTDRAGAIAATQPSGCELAKWPGLLIRASTCKRVRSFKSELRRSRHGRVEDPVAGHGFASIGGMARQPYCAVEQKTLGSRGKAPLTSGGMPYRLQLALVFVAPVMLLLALYGLGLALGVEPPLLGRGYVIRVELPDPSEGVGLPPVEGPQGPGRPLIVIDAGHGGHDPGASGTGPLAGTREKTLALGLARALRDELLRGGGVRVAMTRDDDRFLALEERSEIARALGADLFLSIHADSAGEKSGISGASVYTLSARASSEAAERFAARENSADMVNGVRLAGRDEN